MKSYFAIFLFLVSFILPIAGYGEVSTDLPDLAPGESVTFRYRVKINPSNTIPAGKSSIVSQGIVSSTQFPNLLTDDPTVSGGSDSTQVLLVVRDSDGDGVGDDLDNCPTSAFKVEPGSCGCVAVDSDSNGNGIFDCFLNDDLKERLALGATLLKQLKPNSKLKNKKKRKVQKERKKQLRLLQKELQERFELSSASIETADSSVDIQSLSNSFLKSIKGA